MGRQTQSDASALRLSALEQTSGLLFDLA